MQAEEEIAGEGTDPACGNRVTGYEVQVQAVNAKREADSQPRYGRWPSPSGGRSRPSARRSGPACQRPGRPSNPGPPIDDHDLRWRVDGTATAPPSGPCSTMSDKPMAVLTDRASGGAGAASRAALAGRRPRHPPPKSRKRLLRERNETAFGDEARVFAERTGASSDSGRRARSTGGVRRALAQERCRSRRGRRGREPNGWTGDRFGEAGRA